MSQVKDRGKVDPSMVKGTITPTPMRLGIRLGKIK